MAKQAPPVSPSVSTLRWAMKPANHPKDPTDPTLFLNKTILITGPTSGVGYESAVKLARLGTTTLIFGVRSLSRGQNTKKAIEHLTGCNSNVIKLYELDMLSHASVKRFAEEVLRKHERIDMALLNAGVSPLGYEISGSDGWENAMQVNVLSTAQLALLLLPRLRETGAKMGSPAHLSIVTSHGYLLPKLEQFQTSSAAGGNTSLLEHVNSKAQFKVPGQYLQSKLMAMWMVDGMAARTSADEVIVSSCCPGLCRTNLGRDAPAWMKVIAKGAEYFLSKDQELGGRLLTSSLLVGKEAHGKFFTNDWIYEPGPLVESEQGRALGKKCWEEIVGVLAKQDPTFKVEI